MNTSVVVEEEEEEAEPHRAPLHNSQQQEDEDHSSSSKSRQQWTTYIAPSSPSLPLLFPCSSRCFAFFCLAWLRSLQPPSRKRTHKRRKRSKQPVSSYWFKKIKLGEPAVPPTAPDPSPPLPSMCSVLLFIAFGYLPCQIFKLLTNKNMQRGENKSYCLDLAGCYRTHNSSLINF